MLKKLFVTAAAAAAVSVPLAGVAWADTGDSNGNGIGAGGVPQKAGTVLKDNYPNVYNGDPLTAGIVVFHPKSKPGVEATGIVAADGTFKMATFGKSDGAIPGEYLVSVEPLALRAPGGKVKMTQAEARIPRMYLTPETSFLKVEVKAGENELEPFRLQ